MADNISMEDLELAKQVEDRQEAERRRRKQERVEFLQKSLSFHDQFRQASMRVNYMKSHRDEMYHPIQQAYLWGLPKEAERLLSQFKYHKGKTDMAERMLNAAQVAGSEETVKEWKEERNKHLMKSLYAGYGISVLYGMFIDGV